MMSHDLMNINPQAYKYKHLDAASRGRWWLNDIISIHKLHNFYTGGKPSSAGSRGGGGHRGKLHPLQKLHPNLIFTLIFQTNSVALMQG